MRQPTPSRAGRQNQNPVTSASVPVVERFEGGALPPEWTETVAQLHTRSSALLKVMEALATQLKAMARENPGDAARCAKLYSRLGVLAPRLQHLQATAELWLQEPLAGQPPLAVSHEAERVADALNGAADKLLRALDTAAGRRRDAQLRDSIRGRTPE